jgi:hypothetical protein
MDAFQLRLGFLLVSAHEHHFGSRGREALAHRAAQFTRASDDDRDFAAKRKKRI